MKRLWLEALLFRLLVDFSSGSADDSVWPWSLGVLLRGVVTWLELTSLVGEVWSGS